MNYPWRGLLRICVLGSILVRTALPDAIAAATSPAGSPLLRERAWAILSSIVATREGKPAFTDWFNEADVFAPGKVIPSRRLPFPGLPVGASVPPALRLPHFADAPLITFVHYDRSAVRHIRGEALHREERLQELTRSGTFDAEIPAMRTVPRLPSGARVIMSAWWPVAARHPTPLPVWDRDSALREEGSNDYPSWPGVVAIARQDVGRAASLTFAGRAFDRPQHVALDSFFHLPVDRTLAARLMDDPGSRKAVTLVLGRPLQAGDSLALVAFHLMQADAGNGTWATFWWREQTPEMTSGRDRPDSIGGVWAHYAMDVTADAVEPREPDGSPRICFNPWFEARFPGGVDSNGIRSNCVNCHARASYPKTDFLPVRRGEPDTQSDPAFAPGRLRTTMLWSLANPGREGN